MGFNLNRSASLLRWPQSAAAVTGLCRFVHETVRLHQAIQCRPADAEQPRGHGQGAVAAGKRLLDDFPLRAQPGGPQVEVRQFLGRGRQFQVGGIDQAPVRHHHRALQPVLQFAHIAGPVMVVHRMGGMFGEAADVAAELLIEAVEEVVGQQHNVAAALAQRRNAHGDGVHAVEQVAAEGALA